MNQQTNDVWTSASQAREKLAEQIQDRSDVCFVDIGYPQNGSAAAEISLRIHVCENSAATASDTFPAAVDGIPVVVARSV